MVDLRVLRVCYACPRRLDGVKGCALHCLRVSRMMPRPRLLDVAKLGRRYCLRTLRRTCATIATLRRPSSVEAAMRSGWLVRSCLAAPARSGPLATSALVPANMTMQAAVLRIGLYRWRFLQKRAANLLDWRPLQRLATAGSK